MRVNLKASSQLPAPSSQLPAPSSQLPAPSSLISSEHQAPGSQFPVISTKLSVPVTVGQKRVHVFRILSIRADVIPGEDPESRVRFDTLDPAFGSFFWPHCGQTASLRGNDIEGMYGLSPRCTGSPSQAPGSKHQDSSFKFPVPSIQVNWVVPPYLISTSGRDP